MATIVIDPGHGGTVATGNSSPNNATGPAGTREKNVTLDLAVRTAEILVNQGHNAILTRNSDVNLGLRDRALVAFNNNAEAFLSIHFNGNSSPSVQGTETWVHSASISDSRLLAASVQSRLVPVTGYNNRGVKAKALGVLSMAYHNPTTACCLVEVSFITDPADESRLAGAAYKNQIAAALAQALIDYVTKSTHVTPAVPVQEGPQTGELDG